MNLNNIHTAIVNDLNFVLFSRYRPMLMGVAILGVLTGHFFSLSGIVPSNILTSLIGKIYVLVFTQGFLFLSGLGLYFSYSKNANTIDFYKRRFYRLFVPYVIITTPYFIFQDFFVNSPNLLKFMGHITTLGYWTSEGNFNGLWYIAVSVVLYSIYPLAHKFVFARKENFSYVLFKWAILMAIVSVINVYIIKFLPNFYYAHNLGIEQYSIFFVGMFTGYVLQRKELKYQVSLFLFFVLSFVLQRILPELNFLYEPMKKVCIYMLLTCVFFYIFDGRLKLIHWLKIALDWMGTYSLELYLLQSIIYCFFMRLKLELADSMVSISMAIILSLLFCQPVHIQVNKIVNGLRRTNSYA